MNRLDAAILLIRAFALYAFFKATEYLLLFSTTYITLITHPDSTVWSSTLLFFLAVPLAWLAIAVVLFIRSRSVALRILAPPDLAAGAIPAEEPPPAHPIALASALFSVIGVAAVIYSIPPLLELGCSVVLVPDRHQREVQFAIAEPKLLAHAAQLLLGFLLFLKSRALATAWWRKQAPVAT